PAQYFQVTTGPLARLEGSAMHSGNVLPELPKVRKYEPGLPAGADDSQPVLPRGSLQSNPPAVLAMEEKRLGNPVKRPIQGKFGQHAAVGIRKVTMDRRFLQDGGAHEAENRFTEVLHAHQIAKAYVSAGRIHARAKLMVGNWSSFLIYIRCRGIAEHRLGMFLQHLQAA